MKCARCRLPLKLCVCPKEIKNMPQAQIQRNPGMAILPSGRPFHFASVIDAEIVGDVEHKQMKFTQQVPGGTREVVLEGKDAELAYQIVHDFCFIDGTKPPSVPGTEIVIAQQEPKGRRK